MAEEAAAANANPEGKKGSGEDRESKLKKLASFLIMIGPEMASELMKTFDSKDIKEISGHMAKIEMIDFKSQQTILDEFSAIAIEAATSMRGGSQYTKEVLEKSVGSFQASELLQDVASKQLGSIDTRFLQAFDAQQLVSLLKSEDPQTIALILTYLDSMKCGEVLALLNSDLRADVVSRIAGMEPVSMEVLGRILGTLKKKVGAERSLSSKTGGMKTIAEVINNMDNAVSRSLLSSLDEKNPELANSIKKLLFSFEDLKKLDKLSLQKILREVESRDLSLSLKTASEALQQAIYTALPKRAADSIKDEIKFMGPVRLRDIEAAQERIIEAMRKLEAEGEIIVSGGGGKNEMVV
ncbi:MAG: flagellar motor switch protein FliG [Verrucomicrobiae bacterium]|nr:flagellar motor switch protein FliG [Verrucomicrobiae bacterium]